MKKSILFLFVASIALFSCHQALKNSYTITGDLTGLKDPYIYFQGDVGDSIRNDSAAVNEGKFIFHGNAPQPYMAGLYIIHGSSRNIDRLQFYVQNGDIHITGNVDSLDNVKITGSPIQNEYEAYKASMKDITDQEKRLYKQSQEASQKKDSAAVTSIEKQIESLDKQINQRTETYIISHPKSLISLNQLQGMTYSTPYAELTKLFTGLDTSLQNSVMGKKLSGQLAIMEKTSAGKPALAFTQNDVNGKPVSLSDFKGKYVLLDFWASWCGPCRAENPNVLKAYNQFKDKGFTVLSVSMDDDAAKWKEAVAKDHLPWTQISDLKGWKNAVGQQYKIRAIPSNFLLDTNGIILARNLRGEDLEKKLAEVLK